MGSKNTKASGIGGDIGNTAVAEIADGEPYTMEIEIEGVCPIIFHRWNVESIDEKSKAAKGSKTKKEDNVESYLYRNANGVICIPGEYFRQALIHAAKYKQDPRSPRKSLMDMAKAALIVNTHEAPMFRDEKPVEKYFEDKRRVTIQRAGITRVRPAVPEGWRATFSLTVLLPEYVSASLVRELTVNAGRLVGLADFRPTYGRFSVVACDVVALEN